MKQQQFFEKPKRFLSAFIFILCLTGFSVQAYAVDWPGSTGQATWADLGAFINSASVPAGGTVELTQTPSGINSTITISKSVTLKSKTGSHWVLTKTNAGRHITIDANTTLTLENITLDGGKVGGGIESSAANVHLILNNGAKIQNCYTTISGGGVRFYVSSINTVTINPGVIISGNTAFGSGGGIYAANIYMKGGTIQGNYGWNGGGIAQNHSKGVCEITGGTIGGGRVFNSDEISAAQGVNDTIGNYSEGSAGLGGGIYAAGKLIISNSVIKGNRSHYMGGGVYQQGDTAILTHVTISNNQTDTSYGGGVYTHYANAILNVTDCTISGNTAYRSGGGIHCAGTVTMNSGLISGNTASSNSYGYGGGIYCAGTVTMNSGLISGNTANTSGGGIHASNIYMKGGTIQGNYTGRNGGGIYQSESGGVCEITGGTIGGGRTFNSDEISAAKGVNDTIGNYSNGISGGGGIYAAGTLTVSNSSIKGNMTKHQASSGGGIYIDRNIATITEATITNNYTENSGGGIYVNQNATLTITGSVINGNTAVNSSGSGGGIYNKGSLLTLNNCDVSYNTVLGLYGGGIFSYTNTTLNINNCTIRENTASHGGGIYSFITTVTISGENTKIQNNIATIQNNITSPNGGGICGGGTLTIKEGVLISGNRAVSGGGIYWDSGKLTVKEGVLISGNRAGNQGGGIYAANIFMNNATIQGNFALQGGGGIYQSGSGVCEIIGSTIGGGKTFNDQQIAAAQGVHDTIGNYGVGGGIYAKGTLTVNNSAIKSNRSSSNGGGIYHNNTTVDTATLTNVTISGNTAGGNTYSGGGVYIANSNTTLNITGGTISGNTANTNGGGIYAANIDMENGTIQGNYAGGNGGGIYQSDSTGMCKITGGTIGGGRTFNGSEIAAAQGVNDAIGNYGVGGGIYAKGTLTVNNSAIKSNRSSSNGGGIYHNTTVGDTATLTNVTISGNTALTAGGGIYAANIDMENGTIQGNYAGGNGGGIYQNGSTGMCKITGGTIGGGKTFTDPQIAAAQGVNDTIGNYCNISGSGGGGGIYAQGKLTVSNSSIKGNRSKYRGGGIYHNNSTVSNTVIFKDAIIRDNNAIITGGGVHINSANTTLNITGGNISNNTTNNNGGGIYCLGTIIMNSGLISGNTANDSGGGIFANNIDMADGTIQGNYAGIYAGGIYQNGSNGICTITGGTIGGGKTFTDPQISAAQGVNDTIGNYCGSTSITDPAYGGGIYAQGTLTVSNSAIKSNKSKSYGGGIYNYGGTVNINTGAVISGNTANINGGGIYISNPVKLFISGGSFSGNTAKTASWIYGSDSTYNNVSAANILTHAAANVTPTTLSTHPTCPFTFVYNNYDVNYIQPTINAPTALTSLPESPVCAGTAITLTASGGDNSYGGNYEWGTGNCGQNIISEQTGNTYTITTPAETTTYWVRRVGISPCNITNSECKTIDITVADTFTQNDPVDATICSGATHTFTLAAATGGSGTITYQWQRSANGTSWSDITNATSANYTTPALTTNTYYRRQATNATCGGTISSAAALVSMSATFTQSNPVSDTICSGTTHTFIVPEATGGAGTLTYQWQESNNNGNSWSNISNATSANYTAPSKNKVQYRRQATRSLCGGTITSSAAVVTTATCSLLTYNLNDDNTGTASRNGGDASASVPPGKRISNTASYIKNTTTNMPTRPDYSFEGWYRESACTTAVGTMAMPSQPTPIYAKWKEKLSFAETVVNGGTQFFVAFGRNDCNMNPQGNVELILRITAVDENANVLLHFKDNPAVDTTFTVGKGEILDYKLTGNQMTASYSAHGKFDIFSHRSIDIVSSEHITVVAVSTAHASMEATQVLSVDKLGTEYIVSGMNATTGASCTHFDGYIAIATEDNTTINQNVAGSSHSVTFNRGDVIYGEESSVRGAHITSNKPIALFQSGTSAEIEHHRNHTFEQLPPTHQWGTKFVVPTIDLNAIYARIYAKENPTIITLRYSDNTPPETYTLNGIDADRYKDIKIDVTHHENAKACYIESDNLISVSIFHLQYNENANGGYGEISQPGMAWLPSVEQKTRQVLLSPLDLNGAHIFIHVDHYMIVMAPTEGKENTTISINGGLPQPIQNINGFSWIADNIGGSGYSFGRYYFGASNTAANPPVHLNTVAVVDNPGGVVVLAYGQGNYTNYFYSAGDGARNLQQDPDWARLRYAIEDQNADTVTVYPYLSLTKEQLIGTHYHLVLHERNDSIYSDGTFINVDHNVYITYNGDLPTDTLVLFTENATDGRHFELSGNTTKTFAFNKVAIDGGEKAGGINITAETSTIAGAVIQNCVSATGGGGIEATLESIASLTIDNSSIKNCKAGYNVGTGAWSSNGGGGIYAHNTVTLTVTNSIIDSCRAGGYGGGIYSTDAYISYSSVQRNKAALQGSIAMIGGGIHSSGNMTLSHSSIKNNSCINNAGGINAKNLTLVGNIEISDNTSGNFGGGIFAININVSDITKLVVSGNTSIEDGGGMYIMNDLIFPHDAVVEISGNISADGDGGGIHVEDGVLHIAGNFTVSNNKAGNNGGGLSVYTSTDLTVHGNNIIFSDNKAIKPYWIKHDDLYRGVLGSDIINTHAPAHPPLKNNTFSKHPAGNLPFEYAYNNYDVNWAPKNGDTTNLPPFQIWNWADLAYLANMVNTNSPEWENNYGKVARLMQNLGIPDSIGTYGTGLAYDGVTTCDYLPLERRNGWYGYQNFRGAIDGAFNKATTYNPANLPVWGQDSIPLLTLGWKPDGTGWIPIGDSKYFNGIFEGNNREITGLWTFTNSSHTGLFGMIGYGHSSGNHTPEASLTAIRNLGVNIAEKGITGYGNNNMHVGGLVAYAINNVSITDCFVTGNVSGQGIATGGLVGWMQYTAEVKNCYTAGNVKGREYTGGLIGGMSSEAKVTDCFTAGNVTVTENVVGGLSGYAEGNVEITNCYTTGNISADSKSEESNAGGLVGYLIISFTDELEITNCYATGDISGTGDYVGGLIGQTDISHASGSVVISDCYAFNSKISGLSEVGRILGGDVYLPSSLINNYAISCMKVNDETITDTDNGYGKNDVHGANITLAQATDSATFAAAPYANAWDWTTDWDFVTPPGSTVKVAKGTNLPVLRAFDISTPIFAGTVQSPKATCGEKPPFQIWNWADLAYVRYLAQYGQLNTYPGYIIMQDIGVPGANNYGDGSATEQNGNVACPYEPPRNEGWYGYQNYILESAYSAGTVVHNTLDIGGEANDPIATKTADPNGNFCWDANGWLPISFNKDVTFDGQGFTVSGLWIDRDEIEQGLFGTIYHGHIKNVKVHIDSRRIIGRAVVGGLAGTVNGKNVVIEDITVTGAGCLSTGYQFSATDYNNYYAYGRATGGAIGAFWEGTLKGNIIAGDPDTNKNGTIACTNPHSHHSANAYIGGVIGYVFGTTLDANMRNYMTVTAENKTNKYETGFGGIIGMIRSGEKNKTETPAVVNTTTIIPGHKWENYGYVDGQSYVGGIVGNYSSWDDSNIHELDITELDRTGAFFSSNYSDTTTQIINHATVQGNYTDIGGFFGSFLGFNSGLINVTNLQTVTSSGSTNDIGGVVGYFNGILRGQIINGAAGDKEHYISGDNCVGGVFGYSSGLEYGLTIDADLINYMPIICPNPRSLIGGVIGGIDGGFIGYPGHVFANYGDITMMSAKGAEIGGIAGRFDLIYDDGPHYWDQPSILFESLPLTFSGIAGPDVIQLISEGAISTTAQSESVGGYFGGFYFFDHKITFENITNTIPISGDTEIGGFIGHFYTSDANTQFINIKNEASISGTDMVGGIVGLCESDTLHFVNCTNIADITGAEENVGGITGKIKSAYRKNWTNIYLTNVNNTGNITGRNNVGGLVGSAEWAEIDNSSSKGAVTGVQHAGGLVGITENTTITHSYAAGNVNGSGIAYILGGFVGLANNNTKITDSYATGDVTGKENLGGFVGAVYDNVTISGCYATGAVSGVEYLGGLAGLLQAPKNTTGVIDINNCYATSNITGTGNYLGGLIGSANRGQLTSKVTVANCYANGEINAGSSSMFVGGLIGAAGNLEIKNCYAFNSKIIIPNSYSGMDVVWGRIMGMDSDLNDLSQLSNNFAYDAMEIKIDGVTKEFPNSDPNDKNGGNVSCGLVIQDANGDNINTYTTTHTADWLFVENDGSSAPWTFNYEYNNAQSNYKVTEFTNLPILAAFNKTTSPKAVQEPNIDCCITPDTVTFTTNNISVCSGQTIDDIWLKDFISYDTQTATVEFYEDYACATQFTSVTANHTQNPSHTLYVITRNIAKGCVSKPIPMIITVTLCPCETPRKIIINN